MSTAVPPMPAPVPPGLSEPQRIVNTFIAPSKTFEDVRRNASWWVPWLIGAIVLVIMAVMVNKKLDLESLVREQLAARSQTFDTLPKEQQEQQVAFALKIAKITPYLIPIGGLIVGLVAAAILMACFNFIHEAAVPYTRSLAIFFYGGLPSLITAAFVIITLAIGTDIEGRNPRNLVATNLGYFMDYRSGSKFLYGLAESLDVISIWVIVLIGIGFKLNSAKPKLSTGSAIGTVAALYILWRLIASSLGWV